MEIWCRWVFACVQELFEWRAVGARGRVHQAAVLDGGVQIFDFTISSSLRILLAVIMILGFPAGQQLLQLARLLLGRWMIGGLDGAMLDFNWVDVHGSFDSQSTMVSIGIPTIFGY